MLRQRNVDGTIQTVTVTVQVEEIVPHTYTVEKRRPAQKAKILDLSKAMFINESRDVVEAN